MLGICKSCNLVLCVLVICLKLCDMRVLEGFHYPRVCIIECQLQPPYVNLERQDL